VLERLATVRRPCLSLRAARCACVLHGLGLSFLRTSYHGAMCIRHSELRRSSRSDRQFRGRANSAAPLPMPGDVRAPTPRNAGKASTTAPRAPRPGRRPRASSARNGHTQAQAQAQAQPETHTEAQNPGAASETARGTRGETYCEDPECCYFWERPCRFCAASACATASSPPDRAPDSPPLLTEPARRSDGISATECNAARSTARKLAAKQALRYREAVLAAQSLDAALWKAIKVAV
jgi:hypothetical protein